MKAFRINHSFTIMPDKNLVNDIKLEPRLMKLLCLLAENPRKVVSREDVIEKIWKGYGGGDEGLTQAISFLRKLLQDQDKSIIETVPKTGYIFNADVEMLTENLQKATNIKNDRWQLYLISGVIIIMLLWMLFTPQSNEKSYAPIPPNGKVDETDIAPKNE